MKPGTGNQVQRMIRRYRAEDLPEMAGLARAYFEELGLDYDAQGLDQDLAEPEKVYRDGGILVADMGGRLVGMVGLRIIEPGQGELKRMYLQPDQRGSGLGRGLLDAALEMARELGLRSLVLDTKLRLKPANRLYESVGFRDIEDYNQNPRAQRFMKLEL